MELSRWAAAPVASDLCSDRAGLRLTRRTLLASALVGLSGAAHAADAYPTSPVTLLVPYSAGSGNDIVARALATKMPAFMGGSLVVENRGGASGDIAIEATRRARPDGYTILLGSVGVSINRYVMKVNYEATDFTSIAKIAELPFTFIVNKSVAASSLKELAALMKAKPDQFSAGEGGAVGSNYFILQSFAKAEGVKFIPVPYKGTADAMVDLLAGRIQMIVAPISTGLGYYKTGDVKVLGISGTKRSAIMPNVPTFTEQGYPTMNISTWFALMGPKGLPDNIVTTLSDAAVKALKTTEVTTPLVNQGIIPDYSPPDQMAAFLKADMAKWQKLIAESGINK